MQSSRKLTGSYYTPDPVALTLLGWGIWSSEDRLLDPSCGDGRFIAGHRNAVGVEQDAQAVTSALTRAPLAKIETGDFFAWAGETSERFDCVAGNPPFIRYQTFKGAQRERASALCARLGVHFTGLASSWAPFLVAAASLLDPGGRMAFVVPAEIGHAPYAAPLLEYLVAHFSTVQIVAVREKLFPELSEDCWLLYAEGFGGHTSHIRFTALDRFVPMASPPKAYSEVNVAEWRSVWNRRLRPFLLPTAARELYQHIASRRSTRRFGQIAEIGIGYVSGANDFFHLRPSEARHLLIPKPLLQPSVRTSRALPSARLTRATVDQWIRRDDPILLLRLAKTGDLPGSVRRYLNSEKGESARQAYKCRTRDPWYAVPDVRVPDYFLNYMSGLEPNLVRNNASCTCTNSLHSVRVRPEARASAYLSSWGSDFVRLSCEIEGHPLGGGMLKLEPREAAQVVLPSLNALKEVDPEIAGAALRVMRQWRHYAAG